MRRTTGAPGAAKRPPRAATMAAESVWMVEIEMRLAMIAPQVWMRSSLRRSRATMMLATTKKVANRSGAGDVGTGTRCSSTRPSRLGSSRQVTATTSTASSSSWIRRTWTVSMPPSDATKECATTTTRLRGSSEVGACMARAYRRALVALLSHRGS